MARALSTAALWEIKSVIRHRLIVLHMYNLPLKLSWPISLFCLFLFNPLLHCTWPSRPKNLLPWKPPPKRGAAVTRAHWYLTTHTHAVTHTVTQRVGQRRNELFSFWSHSAELGGIQQRICDLCRLPGQKPPGCLLCRSTNGVCWDSVQVFFFFFS